MSRCDPQPDGTNTVTCMGALGCPNGYHATGVPIKGFITCSPTSPDPNPNPGPTFITQQNVNDCTNDGYIYLGPGHLEFWEANDPDTTNATSARFIARTYCKNFLANNYPLSAILSAWKDVAGFLLGNVYKKAKSDANVWNCFKSEIRYELGGVDNDFTITTLLRIASNCINCKYYYSTPAYCYRPPQPINPLPPTPLFPLCPPGKPCLQPLTPVQNPPIVPIYPPDNVPVPDNNTPWWKKDEEEILYDLSLLDITPQWLAGVTGFAAIFGFVTRNLPWTLYGATVGLATPWLSYQWRYGLWELTNWFHALEKDWDWFEQFIYPILTFLISISVTGLITWIESYFGLPGAVEAETFGYGFIISLLASLIVWFLNTEVGQGLTGAGKVIVSFIDYIVDAGKSN